MDVTAEAAVGATSVTIARRVTTRATKCEATERMRTRQLLLTEQPANCVNYYCSVDEVVKNVVSSVCQI